MALDRPLRIAYIVPGNAGRFYCENCLRDSGLVRALARLGHKPIEVPVYLPHQVEADRAANENALPAPIFYGAINLYLKHQFAFFGNAPGWLNRLLDAPGLLRWASRLAGATEAHGMGELTLSMLKGERGGQAEELEKLIDWLRTEARPDVVHLSNMLLIGMARRIRQSLGVPVLGGGHGRRYPLPAERCRRPGRRHRLVARQQGPAARARAPGQTDRSRPLRDRARGGWSAPGLPEGPGPSGSSGHRERAEGEQEQYRTHSVKAG